MFSDITIDEQKNESTVRLITQEEIKKRRKFKLRKRRNVTTEESLFRHQNLYTVYRGHSTVSESEILNNIT